MKEKSITVNQISAIFIAILPLIKLITAPAVFSGYSNEKLWQPLFLLIVIDLLMILFYLYIDKKFNGQSFYEILTTSYGSIVAKIVFFIYFIFFLSKSILPLIEQKELIENAFYETLPQVPAFYPVFIIIFYLSLKGFKTLGRISQFCLFITIPGIMLILFLSFPTAEYKYLAPLFSFNTKSVAICALNGLSWFCDSIYLLFFCGHFKRVKNNNLKIIASYLSGAIITTIFFITFYAIFTFVSQTQKIALNSISVFGVTLVNVGRFDYIALFLLTISSAISISIPLITATYCLSEIFRNTKKEILALICTVIPLLIIIFFASKYESVLLFITRYLTPLYIICGYVLPFLCIGGKKNDLQTS